MNNMKQQMPQNGMAPNNMGPPRNGMNVPPGAMPKGAPQMNGPPNGQFSQPQMGGGSYQDQQNRVEYNQDPSRGGFQWRKSPMTPMLAYSAAVNNTPDHSTGQYVIPWDNK